MAQQVATATETLPSPMPLEPLKPLERETVKVQLTVSINTLTGSVTNISQHLRLDVEALEFHPAGSQYGLGSSAMLHHE